MSEDESVAIACDLTVTDLQGREEAWRRLLSVSLVRKSAIANGVRLELGTELQTAHTALDLLGAERDCCSWANWTLMNGSGVTVLEITANEDGAHALQQMFGLD